MINAFKSGDRVMHIESDARRQEWKAGTVLYVSQADEFCPICVKWDEIKTPMCYSPGMLGKISQ